MVSHGCNCSGYSDYIRMVTIKNDHCCNTSHGGEYNSVWTHSCGTGCGATGGFWQGLGAGALYGLTSWLMGGLCSMGSWFGGGLNFSGGFGLGNWGLGGMTSLCGGNGNGYNWWSNSQTNTKTDDYYSSRYGGKDVKETLTHLPVKPTPEGENLEGVKNVETKIGDYTEKLQANDLTKDKLTGYRTELQALLGDNNLTDEQKNKINNLISDINKKLGGLEAQELLESFTEEERALLGQIDKDNDEYKKYTNANPEDLKAEGTKVLYARDIVGYTSNKIRDVEPSNNNDKVTISSDGKTITIQDSEIAGETKEVKYKYVNTVNDEALYRSENGQLYVLQKTSTGEYILNQYSWHKGSGEKDVSSANA